MHPGKRWPWRESSGECRETLESISEGLEKTMRKETAVEVNKAKEALKILNKVRLGVVGNGVNIGGKGSDASGSDLVAKEGNRRLGKGAFGEVNEKAIGLKNVKVVH